MFVSVRRRLAWSQLAVAGGLGAASQLRVHQIDVARRLWLIECVEEFVLNSKALFLPHLRTWVELFRKGVIPAAVAGQAWRVKRRRGEEQRLNSARGREKTSDDIFVCERVCTSKRMLKKVGAFSKDPTPDTCVTVCGVSELDACADSCARTVCVNKHQVPNWNDICLRRCQSECLKLSNSSKYSS